MENDVDKRFEHADRRIDDLAQWQKLIQQDMDRSFEQVDKRFEQMIVSINSLSDRLDKRDLEHRSFTLRMFSISIMFSFLGLLGWVLSV